MGRLVALIVVVPIWGGSMWLFVGLVPLLLTFVVAALVDKRATGGPFVSQGDIAFERVLMGES